MGYITIFVTCPNKKESYKITQVLMESRIAACVSEIKNVNSKYWWKGKIEKSKEVLLIMKTTKRHFPKVVKEIKKNHSYEVPEIIAFPIIAGSADYLKWIENSVDSGQ
jgi:periplasmic divalent cation tolerance protein